MTVRKPVETRTVATFIDAWRGRGAHTVSGFCRCEVRETLYSDNSVERRIVQGDPVYPNDPRSPLRHHASKPVHEIYLVALAELLAVAPKIPEDAP